MCCWNFKGQKSHLFLHFHSTLKTGQPVTITKCRYFEFGHFRYVLDMFYHFICIFWDISKQTFCPLCTQHPAPLYTRSMILTITSHSARNWQHSSCRVSLVSLNWDWVLSVCILTYGWFGALCAFQQYYSHIRMMEGETRRALWHKITFRFGKNLASSGIQTTDPVIRGTSIRK